MDNYVASASLTYVCFVSAKGLIRHLSSNSSNTVKFLYFFKLSISILSNWESLCDIRPENGPDYHHHFDAPGMFDELAKRSLMNSFAFQMKRQHSSAPTR